MLARTAIARGIAGGYTPPPANDASFNNVTMLMKSSQTNGSNNNSFLDSSPSPFTLTRNGNPTQGAVSPYGGRWSVQFTGSTGSYMTITNNSTLKFNAADFTVEAWVNPDATAPGFVVSEYNNANNTGQFGLLYQTNDSVRFYWNYGSSNESRYTETSAGSVPRHKWTHVAVVRSGFQLRIYINGVAAATENIGTNSLWNGSSLSTYVGRCNAVSGGAFFAGYISNVRIVTSAVYTANFTPPTSVLTAITNTQFLSLVLPYPKDSSTNDIPIAWQGVSATKFSPYARTAAYSPSTEGGSGYFDGNNDYLSFTGNSNTQLNSGDFTVEFWMKRETGADQVILDSGGGQVFEITVQSNHTMYVYDGSTSWTTPALTRYLLYPGAWHHIAVTVSSTNNLIVWINGQAALNISGMGRSWTQSTWKIGQWWSGTSYDFRGWLSDVRIVKGSLVYNGTFTPPTAPLTAITNTTLLVGFRNANIYDAAGMVNFENISGGSGAPSVSSGNAKWDTTSVYFPNGYLQTVEKQLYNLSTADFTLEFWILWLGGGSANVLVDTRSSDTSAPWTIAIDSGGKPYFFNGTIFLSTVALTYNTWQHLAIVRVAGVLKYFIDGVQVLSVAEAGPDNAQTNICIGGTSFGTSFRLYAYLDELRFTRGAARYTAGFSVPTSQFSTT